MPLSLTLGSSFAITEASSLAITLSLIDAAPAADGLIFTVSGLSGGSFQKDGSAVTSFTRLDIVNGLVSFLHDGGDNAPAFSISVSDGSETSATTAATISFTAVNDAPSLSLTNIAISEGASVVLNTTHINILDPDTSNANLTITPLNVVGGKFTVSNVDAATFTKADLLAGNVRFVHSGAEVIPTFSFKVSDETSESATKEATINFTPDNESSPTLIHNPFVLSEGGSLLITTSILNATDPDVGTTDEKLKFVTSLVTGGSFKKTVSGVTSNTSSFTLAEVKAGVISFVHDGSENTPTATLKVDDDSTGTIRSSALAAMTFDFTKVNDLTPSLSLGALAAVKSVPLKLHTDFFSATDGDTQTNSSNLSFRISNTIAGRFVKDGTTTVIAFTRKDIEDGKVSFVDDGSGNTPSFSINVFDGINSSATQNFNVSLSADSSKPALALGSFSISEGGTITLSNRLLNATKNLPVDAYVKTVTTANITLSGLQSINGYTLVDGDRILVKDQSDATQDGIYIARAGAWELAADSVATTVLDGKVFGVQNGSDQGDLLILTGSVGTGLVSTPEDATLTFSVTELVGGVFKKTVSSVATTVTTFTLKDVKDGLITFVHDGGEIAPSFQFQVNDGAGHDSIVASPSIAFTPVNDQVPVLTLGAISVGEAASVVITTAMINAADADLPAIADSSLTFTVSNVTGGNFKKAGNNVTSFTLAEIKAGSISFSHDGGESAPGFSITVRDGTNTSASQTGSITLTQINDAPTLTLGAIPVLKGTPLILKVEHINAADVDSGTLDSELTFTVSSVKGGAFKVGGASVTSFTLAQIKNNEVSFADDGTGNGSFTIKVTDNGTAGVDKLSSAEQSATISVSTSTDLPALALGSFAISEGGSLTLSTSILNASAKNGSADNLLVLNASEVKGGSFILNSAYVTEFTLQDVKDGKVSFFHDGSEVAAAFKLTLTEGAKTTVAVSAPVNYTAVNDITPTLILGGADKFVLSESGTGATLLITTAMISAVDLDSTSTDASLTFTASNVVGGSFNKKSGTSSTSVTTFTLKDIRDGNISFVAEGGETQPSFAIKVGDGTNNSALQTASFTFTKVNDAPVLVLGTFPVVKGVPLKITTSIFNATDAEGAADADLKFIVSGLNSGSFKKTVDSVASTVTEFTLADIKADRISFVDGGKKPVFSIKVSDGAAVNPESSARTVEASYSSSSAPALSLGAFTVSEGGTLVITTSLINAASSVADTSLHFYVNSISGANFTLKSGNTSVNARSFTLKDIKDGNVSLVHDGSETTPKFSLKVSDGKISSPVQNGLITYNAVNDNAPVIATLGRFKITEGTSTTLQYVKITQSLLKATDADSGTSNSSLTFNVSSVTGGSFVRLTDTKGNYSPVTSFTQAEMMANKIFFLQSGASVVPTFNVSVSDGSKTSATHSVRFEFTEVNDAPVTSLNAIGLNSGATVVLKKTHLTLKDDEVSDSSLLTFTVTAIKGGSFKKTVDSTATTVKTFTFKDVEDGKISFVHDGSAKASFSLKGSDGELSSSVGQGFFFGIGDAASVSGTKANETFVVTSKTFASIKGGAGNDTLWFGSGVSGDLDLTLPSFDGKIADIEALDLNSAGITLKLNLAEVKALSSSSDAVKIHGEAGNTVIISDLNAWTKGANVTGSTGIEYYRYTNGDATLDIQKEISVSAAPTLSLRTWDLVQNGSFALNGTLLAISDADTASSASLSVSASGLLGGTFRKTGTEGAVSSFTREELEAGQISFLHDGADKVSYTLKVTDNIGLESSSVTRTYEFGIGSGETATGTADANTFVITSQAFTKVDGAAGTDTVRFGAGLTGLFDLTALADTLFKDVEIFELAGTDSILKLNVAEVKALSSTSDRLIVRGSSADEIQIADFASWSKGSDVTRENILYSSYSNAGATLEIQKDISII